MGPVSLPFFFFGVVVVVVCVYLLLPFSRFVSLGEEAQKGEKRKIHLTEE
jgi:hypothetical protein